MIIKKNALTFLLTFLLISISFSLVINNKLNLISKNCEPILINKGSSLQLENLKKSDNFELFDDVHFFPAPLESFTFKAYLEKEQAYNISMEVVTPQECLMKLEIWDPDNCHFNVFESNLSQGVEKSVPFGTALLGNHLFNFTVKTEENLNVRLKIENTTKCLYEKMGNLENKSVILYEVSRFNNGSSISREIYLKDDVTYTFHVGRVSAISIKESCDVRMNYTIRDKYQHEYIIYSNETMAGVDGVNKFNFGTAFQGLYYIDFTVWCDVEHVNVGHAITTDYQTSNNDNNDGVEFSENNTVGSSDNDTESEDIDLFRDYWNSIFSFFTKWTCVILIFSGCAIVFLTSFLIKYRKKTDIHLNL